ncbi:hypothetical protein D3C76_1473230 [compost metagenome]
MRISGGVMPAGICLSTVCDTAVTWALAVRISTLGWKKILTMPMPGNDCDSMCSMSLTVVLKARS